MDFSIIIPMFNAEKFIQRAVESVYQALSTITFEVIIVDDESTDNSVSQIEELQGLYSNLHLLRLKVNAGAGNARNLGFQQARGNYVTFLDADDYYLGQSLLDVLLHAQMNEADVTLFSYKIIDIKGEVSEKLLARDNEVWQYLEPYCLVPQTLDNISACLRLAGFPWNKILKKSFAQSINLHFSETFVLNDVFVHFQTILAASSLLLVNKPVVGHIYDQNNKQLTNIHDSRRIDSLVVLDELNELYQNHPGYRRYLSYLYAFEDDIYDWMYSNTSDEFKNELATKYFSCLDKRDVQMKHRVTVSNQKIILYGLGWKMMEYFDSLAENNHVVGFMDSDLLKARKSVFGYPVYHPSQTSLPDFDLIIICSSYEQEIRRNLSAFNPSDIKSVNQITQGFII